MLDRRSLFRAAIGSWMGRHKLKDAAEELLKKAYNSPNIEDFMPAPTPRVTLKGSPKYGHLRGFLDQTHTDTFRKYEQKRELMRFQQHRVQQFKSWGHGFKVHALKQELDRLSKEEQEEHKVISHAIQLVEERFL